MQKPCQCGEMMNMKLRTVIFSNKVEIHHVPIYSCTACQFSEVFAAVKPELTKLIAQLDVEPQKQVIHFNEVNEWAHLMFQVSDKDNAHIPVEVIIEERINQLLDLILIAQSVDDQVWIADIRHRLQQITECMVSTFDMT